MTYEPFLQFGALGIVAYFVYWLTQKFNGSIKENTNALRANTDVSRDLKDKEEHIVRMLEDRTHRFDAIENAVKSLEQASQAGVSTLEAAIKESSEETLTRLWKLVQAETERYDEAQKGDEP